MVGGPTPNDLWMSLQPATAISLDLLQLVNETIPFRGLAQQLSSSAKQGYTAICFQDDHAA